MALVSPDANERVGLLYAGCNEAGSLEMEASGQAREMRREKRLLGGRVKRAVAICTSVAVLVTVFIVHFSVKSLWRQAALSGRANAGLNKIEQDTAVAAGDKFGKLKAEVESEAKKNMRLQEMVAKAEQENAKLLKKLAQMEAQTHKVNVPKIQGRPVCNGHVAKPPVKGEFRRHAMPNGGEAWDFALTANCSYGLWERSGVERCLQGTWIALIGASNMNIWALELANLISPKALSIAGDYFNIDGVYTQMIDLVFEGGVVVYRNVLVDDERKMNDTRIGVHSVERDQKVLHDAFFQVKKAPHFLPNRTRLTYFIAEFWDHVDLAILAVEAAKEWREAEVTAAVSIGRWYANVLGCTTTNWCAVRPEYGKLPPGGIFHQLRKDAENTLQHLTTFCMPPGRAGQRGCAVFSLSRCQTMIDPKWPDFHETILKVMQGRTSPQLRFVNMWDLTSELVEDCMTGHQSAMSTLWTLQVLLGGICDAADAGEGTLASFEGPMCRTNQVLEKCPNPTAKAVQSIWECAHTESCTLVPVGPAMHGADQSYDYQK